MPIVDGKCKITRNALDFEALLDTVPDHSSAHESAGDDPVNVKNLAGFSGVSTQYLGGDGNFSVPSAGVTYGTTSGTACEGDDSRLSDDRTPVVHHASHAIGQPDALAISDILTLPAVASQYLNGNGTFSIPGGGGATSWVTVGMTGSDADYVCDGTADDVQFQAALDAIATTGAEIRVLAGDYNFAAYVTATPQYGLKIIGIGNVTITAATGDVYPIFHLYGDSVVTGVLTLDSLARTRTVTITDASDVLPGDLCVLVNTDAWCPDEYATQNTGESYVVKAIVTNTITLNQPLIRDYTTAKTSTAKIYRPIKVHIENIKLINAGSAGTLQGIKITYGLNCKIINCDVGFSGLNCIGLQTCYNTEVAGCYLHDAELSGYGYGVSISNSSSYTHIHDNRLERCRHAVTLTYADHDMGLNRATIIANNEVVSGTITSADALDIHSVNIDAIITGNCIYVETGYVGLRDGGYETTFVNNHVYGGDYAVSRRGIKPGGYYNYSHNIIEGAGIYYDYGSPAVKNSISLIGNKCRNGGYAIYASIEEYGSMFIEGNDIDTFTEHCVRIEQAAAATISKNLIFTGNTIRNIQATGVYLRCNSASHPFWITASNNIINGVNLVGDENNGLLLTNVIGANVFGNTIYDDSGNMNTAIYESGSSDYNSIHGNVYGGGAAYTHVLGVHTVVGTDNMEL